MELTEIKKCPFCGGEGQVFVQSSDHSDKDIYTIVCEKFVDCGARSRSFYTQEEVIKWWNRRFSE